MSSLLKSFNTISIGSKARVFGNARLFSTEFDPATTPRRIDFNVAVSPEIYPTISIANASSAQVLKYKKSISVEKYKAHATDCGSPAVQIACMTDKILNLARHTAEVRKDKSGNRGFTMLVHKRAKVMKYLCRTNYTKFVEVCNDLGLQREAKALLKKVEVKRMDSM